MWFILFCYEIFLDRIVYICGVEVFLRNVINVSIIKNKIIFLSEVIIEMLKNKKWDESGKNLKLKIMKL